MKKIRLNAKEKDYMRQIGDDAISLRYDLDRRLRNAVLALALSDPKWMSWLEDNIPPHKIGRHHLQLIEVRTRALVLKNYSFLVGRNPIELIFRQDWAFTDRGTLSPG
jgi:hypothetical protein